MQHTDFCFERNEYTFIQQGCIKISKSDGNDIYNVANEKISHLSIHERIKKYIAVSTKILSELLNIKCVLSSKPAYYNDLRRIVWH